MSLISTGSILLDSTFNAETAVLKCDKNVCVLRRIIEPYSRVQVAYVAGKINLPRDQVEKKLSQVTIYSTPTRIYQKQEKKTVISPVSWNRNDLFLFRFRRLWKSFGSGSKS
jgi:hypothetical protein